MRPEALAKIANTTTEWIVKRYNKTLEISDYQLASAAMRAAETEKSKAREMLWNLTDLFAGIEEAADRDAILELVDEYKARDWESDKAASAMSTGTAKTPQAVEGRSPASAVGDSRDAQ